MEREESTRTQSIDTKVESGGREGDDGLGGKGKKNNNKSKSRNRSRNRRKGGDKEKEKEKDKDKENKDENEKEKTTIVKRNRNRNRNRNRGKKDGNRKVKEELVLIIDPSCFTKGLGHVIQWVNYMEESAQRSSKSDGDGLGPKVTLYLSAYTTEELNFLKNTRKLVSATKSLKLIDAKDEYFHMEIFDQDTDVQELTWSDVLRGLFFGKDQNDHDAGEEEEEEEEEDSDDSEDSEEEERELQRQLVRKLNQVTTRIPSRYKKLIKSYYALKQQLEATQDEYTHRKVYIVSADIYVLQDLNQIFNGTASSKTYEDAATGEVSQDKIEIMDILKADIIINNIYKNNAPDIRSAQSTVSTGKSTPAVVTTTSGVSSSSSSSKVSSFSSSRPGRRHSATVEREKNTDINSTRHYDQDVYAPRGKGELWTP